MTDQQATSLWLYGNTDHDGSAVYDKQPSYVRIVGHSLPHRVTGWQKGYRTPTLTPAVMLRLETWGWWFANELEPATEGQP